MKTYVVLDLETTGLSAQNDRITEVGALKVREDGEILGTLHTMVRLPKGQKVPKFITELTGIRDQDLIGGMQQRDAMRALAEFVKYSTVVAQNAPFDLQFIDEKGKIQPPSFVCTRAMSKLVFPEEKKHNLKAVCERLGIVLEGHHRSMNDVAVTVSAFFKMKDIAEQTGIDYENIVVGFSDRPLVWKPFGAKAVKI